MPRKKPDIYVMYKAYKRFVADKEKQEKERERQQEMILQQAIQKQEELINEAEGILINAILELKELFYDIWASSELSQSLGANTQYVKDLLRYSILEGIAFCVSDRDERLVEAGKLEQKFFIGNPVGYAEHMEAIVHNSVYRQYFKDLFVGEGSDPGFFWSLLGTLTMDQMDDGTFKTMAFLTKYCQFMRGFAIYLGFLYPNLNLEGRMDGYLERLTSNIAEFYNREDTSVNTEEMVLWNPLTLT